jgi:hypothetical protein
MPMCRDSLAERLMQLLENVAVNQIAKIRESIGIMKN